MATKNNKTVLSVDEAMQDMCESLRLITMAAHYHCACDWDSIEYAMFGGCGCDESTWDICRN